ncbi:MAG: glycoside hydrolase family 3 C-terminal domain-containing protein [Oscillospiraceae bacterium]|nr:glycoside hydrolase family 3 C-terminal domain-containing protein [Oscillospiraceae bacterium]
MEKWARINYQPCLPLGDNNSRITGCEKHIALSREAAGEGIVLLKNEEKTLPLKKGSKVAIFGKAQIDYVKGGGGSGDVHCEYVRNIYEGLKLKSDKVEVFDKLSAYYEIACLKAYAEGEKNGLFDEFEIPEELLSEAKAFTDTAIITINRYSCENEDRRNDGKDTYFALSDNEKKMVCAVTSNFKNVIVLLNTGAMIDTSWFSENSAIKAALIIWQGGMEGGLATADVLVGDVTPSGKLVDTCAEKFEDYPSSEGFHESEAYVKYTEDIFVGYRFFETIPGKKKSVVYPFGYGLSYTDFEFSDLFATKLGEKIFVSVTVKNAGEYSGKEVVQVYYGAPQGKLTKPALELCAFGKTKLLKPGECETQILSFDINQMASYDDTGDICKSAYVLEAGDYKIFAGNSVRNLTELDYIYHLEETKITEQLTEYCAPKNLGKRLIHTGEYVDVPKRDIPKYEFKNEYDCKLNIPDAENKKKLSDVVCGKITLDEFIEQLTDAELLTLLWGKKNTGVANTDGMGGIPEYGIPTPMTVDGPAGVRINPKTGVRTTAFPVATMLACTWNTELVEAVGVAGALEAKENNLSIWLTPALNIHRSPLCGRNFEYYSEDPFVSGKMAAAMVRGIQSQKIVATPKHFACNNKETNRFESDSIVSERALREIYLKGFEICIKESKPRLIMTSYNLINGIHSSESEELLSGILRGEWKYDGLVTTDWCNTACKIREIISGNDIRMPSRIDRDVKPEDVTRNQLAVCAKRLLEMILWLE